MISTKHNEEIKLDGNEKLSFSKFLDGKSEKTVNLERTLGIGGEGIVLSHKMDTREKGGTSPSSLWNSRKMKKKTS